MVLCKDPFETELVRVYLRKKLGLSFLLQYYAYIFGQISMKFRTELLSDISFPKIWIKIKKTRPNNIQR